MAPEDVPVPAVHDGVLAVQPVLLGDTQDRDPVVVGRVTDPHPILASGRHVVPPRVRNRSTARSASAAAASGEGAGSPSRVRICRSWTTSP